MLPGAIGTIGRVGRINISRPRHKETIDPRVHIQDELFGFDGAVRANAFGDDRGLVALARRRFDPRLE